MKKFLLSLAALLCVGSAWAASQTTLISGVTLPGLPAGTYNVGTTVSHNGTNDAVVYDSETKWAVMQAVAPGYGSPTAANFTWCNAYNGSDGSYSTTSATWDALSPFVGSSAYTTGSNAHYVNFARRGNVRKTDRTFAYRFTNASAVSVYVKSVGNTVGNGINLAVFQVANDGTQTEVEIVNDYTKTAKALTVAELEMSNTYVAYVYGDNNSNGELYEIAFSNKVPSTATPSFTTDLNSSYNAFTGNDLELSVVAVDYTALQWYQASTAAADPANDTPLGTEDSYTFTPAAAGTYHIYCRAYNSKATGEKYTNSVVATINVTDRPATGVTLDQTNVSLLQYCTVTLVASVLPAEAANKNVTWTSDNIAVATVSDGVVTAKSQGTATITATTVDGGFTANCIVTVHPIPGTLLASAVAGSGTVNIAAGNTYDVTAGDATLSNCTVVLKNGHGSNSGDYIVNNQFNLAGSGSSYLKLTPSEPLKVGDVIVLYDYYGNGISTADAFYVSTSTTKGSNKYTFPYIVTAESPLKGAASIYFWKSGASSFKTVEIHGTPSTIATNANGNYGSFCSASNFTATAGTVFMGSVNGSELTLTCVNPNGDEVIPAGEGVILHGATSSVSVTYTDAAETASMTGNELKGVTERTATASLKNADSDKLYILHTDGSFHLYTGDFIPAYKACLVVNAAVAPQSLTIGFDVVNGISTLEAEQAVAAQLSYDLLGREVKADKAGLRISNGRVVMVK